MRFSNCINYLLSVSQHKVYQRFSAMLAPYDITPAQYGVLNCLWTYDLHGPTEIARMLQLKTTTVSGILDKMQRQGLIQRELNPDTRRGLCVVLAPKGEQIRDSVLETVDRLNREVMAGIPKEEQDVLFSVLRKIGAGPAD